MNGIAGEKPRSKNKLKHLKNRKPVQLRVMNLSQGCSTVSAFTLREKEEGIGSLKQERNTSCLRF